VQTGITGKILAEGIDLSRVKDLGNGLTSVELAKGESVVLHAEGVKPPYVIAPLPASLAPERKPTWGLIP
jgi:hypothetical protein